MNELLPFDSFKTFITPFGSYTNNEELFIYECYEDAIRLLTEHETTSAVMEDKFINHHRLIVFMMSDLAYFIKIHHVNSIISFGDDELFMTKFLNGVIDKYALETHFKFEPTKYYSPFSTEISTLHVYINFILLKIRDLLTHENEYKLMLETLQKAFGYSLITLRLLVEGYPIEALGSWRIIHELEATLILLRQDKAYSAYKQHLKYSLAFHNLLPSEEGDLIFVEIKEKMKRLGLKSKDTKKFIEYGWIEQAREFDEKVHKFNFRDGLEKLAGLGRYNKTYQLSSEVAHSSPLLLFSDERYFLKLTFLNIYESFFRLEELFAIFFKAYTTEEEFNYFLQVRSFYLNDLVTIYQHERQ